MEFISKNEEKGRITVEMSEIEMRRIRRCALDALAAQSAERNEDGINTAFFTLSDIRSIMRSAGVEKDGIM